MFLCRDTNESILSTASMIGDSFFYSKYETNINTFAIIKQKSRRPKLTIKKI